MLTKVWWKLEGDKAKAQALSLVRAVNFPIELGLHSVNFEGSNKSHSSAWNSSSINVLNERTASVWGSKDVGK